MILVSRERGCSLQSGCVSECVSECDFVLEHYLSYTRACQRDEGGISLTHLLTHH